MIADLCTTEIVTAMKKERQFVGAFPCDLIPVKLPAPPYGLIINTDRSKQHGSHWVSVYVTRDNHGEYFDSFGFPPLVQDIVSFLNELGLCFCKSNFVVQHPASVACGHFAIGFLLARFRDVSFEEFLAFFDSSQLQQNDSIIKKWNTTFLKRTSYGKSVALSTAKDSHMGVASRNHASCQWN